jgi:transposase
MTAKKQSGATPQQYDKAFREEAVRMWKASGKAAEVTARELGISVFRLYDWNRGGGASRAADLPRLPDSKQGLEDEVVRLRRELARMTEQRDILKKAAGILSEPPPRDMPGSNR